MGFFLQFFYCHTPLDSVVFISGIWRIFVSNLLGSRDICQRLFWFAQLFFTKGSLPSGSLSDCALFNGVADWGFTRIQIASREGGKSHPVSLPSGFTCWFEVIWPQLPDNSARLARIKMEAGEEFYLCSSEKLPKTKRIFFLSFFFLEETLPEEASASRPNLHCMLKQVKSCLPPTSYFPPAAHLHQQ